MQKNKTDPTLYRTPFSRDFWKSAAMAYRDTRMLILAALFCALRIAIKSLSIPVGEDLHISLDFFVNSVGSMIYGPLMALLVGAVSDTLGAVLFPTGAYFFPFIFVEMLSGFLFGLFLYRAKLGEIRIALSRFTVVGVCNFLINPIIMKWYYLVVVGKDYTLFRFARMIKNLVLLPAEMILLTVWLAAISAATYRLGLTYDAPGQFKLTKKTVIIVILATLFAAACILYYLLIYLKK